MSDARPPAPAQDTAPELLEGWFVLHSTWHATDGLPGPGFAGGEHGASFRILGHRADLLAIAYARTAEALLEVHAGQQHRARAAGLEPAGSFLSIVEASLYEATGQAHAALARRGIARGSDAWDAALEEELAGQKAHLQERVWRPLPSSPWVCYYPMSKRRGEVHNWYALPLDERRAAMRGHGRIGATFAGQVTQVISGATGLDDWEWAVDLFAEDPAVFKRLVTAMRFDEASSRYAEFGPFVVARRL